MGKRNAIWIFWPCAAEASRDAEIMHHPIDPFQQTFSIPSSLATALRRLLASFTGSGESSQFLARHGLIRAGVHLLNYCCGFESVSN
jgi:hypothetical protein